MVVVIDDRGAVVAKDAADVRHTEELDGEAEIGMRGVDPENLRAAEEIDFPGRIGGGVGRGDQQQSECGKNGAHDPSFACNGTIASALQGWRTDIDMSGTGKDHCEP